MKFYVYSYYGKIIFEREKSSALMPKDHFYLGELDLDIKPEKKLVTKEKRFDNAISWGGDIHSNDGFSQQRVVPLDAKNIHITYEVEE
jgi:hypothetical protein